MLQIIGAFGMQEYVRQQIEFRIYRIIAINCVPLLFKERNQLIACFRSKLIVVTRFTSQR